ncbi:MAG: 30S ribosomal protein S1 [Puniceicoccales bacterium]|jgi:small subunit ribosomal protein S1|nr:30S ribosomal protein S1 [Puniceicoccales bacterium]
MENIMEKLLAKSAIARLEPGQIVKGIVTEIRQNDVIIDIGAKSDGTVKLSEFDDPSDVQVGETVEVYLEKLEDENGSPVLCYDRARQQKSWERIASTAEEGVIVVGKIKEKTRGGLLVNIGVDAFLPSSQIDIQPVKNVEQFIGRTYSFKVVKINYDRKNIVLSRRELIEEERKTKSRQLFEDLKVGDMVKGTVKNITDYGAFIDLDGIDGLLHITDMSWGRVTHPNQVVRVGEVLNLVVIFVDQEKARVSLGLKQTMPNPWDNIEQRYPIGACLRGKVVNLVPYGAFVELESGVEGLIHVTEMSWAKKVVKPNDILKIGQLVTAVVIGIQKEEQKIALGLRQLEDNPWEKILEKYPEGKVVTGPVQNLTNYGIFVELEPGVYGMVHISDASWGKKNGLNSFKVGDTVKAVVISVDPDNHRISLGIKQLTCNPWEHINDHFKVGDSTVGKVIKLASFGAFVELEHDVEGFIHIGQLQEEHVEKIRDVLTLGQMVTARIIKVDSVNQRIALSIKALKYSEEQLQNEISACKNAIIQQNDMYTIGDFLDNEMTP